MIHHHPMALRSVKDEDSEALANLIAGVFQEYPGCVFDWSEFPELVKPATSIAAKDGSFWVAEWNGHVVGCVAMLPSSDPELMELKKLYTNASVRGQGLGRRLIEQVEAAARARQASRIQLWTDTRFTTAHRVYERLGYERLADVRYLYDLSGSIEYHYAKLL